MMKASSSPIPVRAFDFPEKVGVLDAEASIQPWEEVTPSKQTEVHRLVLCPARNHEAEVVGKLEVSDGTGTDDDEVYAEPPWCKIALKISFTIVAFLLLCSLIEHVASDKITEMSRAFIKQVGIPGIFVGVFVADSMPQPFTYVPLIFLAVEGGMHKSEVFLVCMLASYSAALAGYAVGQLLRLPSWGEHCFDQLRQQAPYVPSLMERRGAFGVLLAAMLPVPLALATWTAGFFNVDIMGFLFAALGRCPKIAVFVWLSPSPADL